VKKLAIGGLLAIVLLCVACASAADRVFAWVEVTNKAGWQPRDSQGELVHDNKLWILGGWFDSYHAPPSDVWSSADGRNWRQVTNSAPWKHSDLPMTLAFGGRMWLMGGWFNGRLPGHSASNEVWSSSDGANWTEVTSHAGWTPRLAAGAVVFKGKMWILGGTENYYFGDDASLKNDVWSSSDGKNWECVTPHAGWHPRGYLQAVAHDGKIWVMGGGNYVPRYRALNDVWSSPDGIHWTQETAAAPWHPRLWFSAAAYRDCLWVLGGWSNNPSENWGDVWYSRDGRTWHPLKSNRIWKARHEESVFVFQDKLWVAGGHARPLNSEVWSLSIPSGALDEK
jgi:hypothetical protein